MMKLTKPKSPPRTKELRLKLCEDWSDPVSLADITKSLLKQAKGQLIAQQKYYPDLQDVVITADMVMFELDWDYNESVTRYYVDVTVNKPDSLFDAEMQHYERALVSYNKEKQKADEEAKAKEKREYERLKKKYEGTHES